MTPLNGQGYIVYGAVEAAWRERKGMIRNALSEALTDRRVRSFPKYLEVNYLGDILSWRECDLAFTFARIDRSDRPFYHRWISALQQARTMRAAEISNCPIGHPPCPPDPDYSAPSFREFLREIDRPILMVDAEDLEAARQAG